MGAPCSEFQEPWGMQPCNCQLCTEFSQLPIYFFSKILNREEHVD